MPSAFHALVFAFLAYWILLAVASITLLLRDPSLVQELRGYFGRPQKPWLTALGFVPACGALAVVFIPAIPHVSQWTLVSVFIISVANACSEELFWRGITVATLRSSPIHLGASTALFVVFHFAFLLLPLQYHGGALNLVGGAAMMGVLWVWIVRSTHHLPLTMLAHVMVNFFAFSGLFVDNNLLELLKKLP